MINVLPVVFLVVGVGLILFGVSMLRRGGGARRETESWVPAAGVVVGLDESTVSPMTADATVTLRHPIVRFADAQGREREGRALTAASWQRPQEGRRVGLRYDPNDPRRIVIDGAPVGNGPLGTVAGIVFILFGVFWLFIGLVFLAVRLA